MVKLDIIRKSDAQLGDFFAKFTPVALFVGATNGVGRNSIKHFAKSTIGSHPRVYFVGRSRERGAQLESELKAINSDGYYEFISADVSLMTAVDDVCQVIMKKEQYLNLLFMSQANTQKLPDTVEKLPSKNAIFYYSRVRFAVNLIPYIKKAPILRRCVFVFGSGLEGKVVTDDLDGRNLSLLRNRDLMSSMTTLALDKLSQEGPEISWIHNFPGFVESGIWDGMEGAFGSVFRSIMSVLGRFWYMKPEECGQRQLFMATSRRFPPAKVSSDDETGVSLIGGLRPIKAINGKEGGGSYTVNEHGDAVNDKVMNLLAGYKTDGTQDTVWRHTLETFKRITGAERL